MQTCATVICNSKNADEQNIICVNYVLSAKEHVNLILDQIQLENGLENSIKREEPVIDSGAGSPGSDPTTDGGAQGPNNSRSSDTQKSPKSETPEPRTRVRSHNSSNSNSAVLSAEPIPVPNRVEEVTVPVPTTGRRGTKRKMKVDVVVDEIDVIPTVLPEPIHPIVEEHGGESSVKDLENAMSKHLPSPVSNNQTTDFSTDALLKQQQDKSSTIQWIGHHNHHFHQQPPTMPATALLRQLYANRESVIRATTRPATSGAFYPGKFFFWAKYCT